MALVPAAPAVQQLVDQVVMLTGGRGGHQSEEVYDALEPLDDAYYALGEAFENAFQRYFVEWA